jgi:hypothetical protein
VVQTLPAEVTDAFFKGKKIAHRFNDDWYLGVYKYTRRGAGPLHGQRAVYYADDKNVYFHKLQIDEYGVHANWVVVRKVPVVETRDA